MNNADKNFLDKYWLSFRRNYFRPEAFNHANHSMHRAKMVEFVIDGILNEQTGRELLSIQLSTIMFVNNVESIPYGNGLVFTKDTFASQSKTELMEIVKKLNDILATEAKALNGNNFYSRESIMEGILPHIEFIHDKQLGKYQEWICQNIYKSAMTNSYRESYKKFYDEKVIEYFVAKLESKMESIDTTGSETEATINKLNDFFDSCEAQTEILKYLSCMYLCPNISDKLYAALEDSPYYLSTLLKNILRIKGKETVCLSLNSNIMYLNVYENSTESMSTGMLFHCHISKRIKDLLRTNDFEKFESLYFDKFETAHPIDLKSFDVLDRDVERLINLATTNAKSNVIIKAQVGAGAEEFLMSISKVAGKTLVKPKYSIYPNYAGEKQRSAILDLIAAWAGKNDYILYSEGFQEPWFPQYYKLQSSTTFSNLTLALSNPKCLQIFQLTDGKIDDALVEYGDMVVPFYALTVKQRKIIWSGLIQELELGQYKLNVDVYAKNFTLNRHELVSAIKSAKENSLAFKSDFVQELEYNLQSKNTLLGKKEVVFNKERYTLTGINSSVNLNEIVSGAKTFYEALESKSLKKGEASFNILIHGSAGTGKTEFAKYLADTISADLMELKASDILTPFLAQTLSNIANFFHSAEKGKKVLLIDEADSLFCDRYDPSTPEEKKTITNELLTQMENFHGIFICSTNLKKALDPASLRRFTYKAKFNYLDLAGRIHFYKLFMAKFLTTDMEPVDLENLGLLKQLTVGDYKTVVQKNQFANKSITHSSLIEDLKAEMIEKQKMTGSRITPISNATYDLSIINTDAQVDLLIKQCKKFYSILMEAGDKEIDIPNRNMLFYGVAGSGKTELAKYISQQIKAPLLVKKASDFNSKWVGETQQNIAKAFGEAEENGAILLIDEADSMIKNRNSDASEMGKENTNEFLTQLENFKGICILSTNFIDSFDDAILRRLAYKVKFDFVTNEAKIKLFSLYFKDLCKQELTSENIVQLNNIKYLTAGNFKTIYSKYFFDKGEDYITNELLINELAKEVIHKDKKKVGLG